MPKIEYETRTLSVIVVAKGKPIFSEMATRVEIVDEAGGEYVEVSQQGRVDLGKIAINPEEWPMLREVIDTMVSQCRDDAN
jgi:hypothetical protein